MSSNSHNSLPFEELPPFEFQGPALSLLLPSHHFLSLLYFLPESLNDFLFSIRISFLGDLTQTQAFKYYYTLIYANLYLQPGFLL